MGIGAWDVAIVDSGMISQRRSCRTGICRQNRHCSSVEMVYPVRLHEPIPL